MLRFLIYIPFFLFLLACSNDIDLVHDVPSLSLYSVEDCDRYTREGRCLIYNKELFEVPSVIPLDMIFVLDVSPSMHPVLTKVAQGFNHLIESISGFDWQMAFTTADHGDQIFYCEEDKFNEEGTDCLSGYAKEFLPAERWQDFEGNLPYFGRFMPLQNKERILDQTILRNTFQNPYDIFYETITHPDTMNTRDSICSYPPYCQGGNEQPLRVLKSIFSQARSTHKDFFRENVGVVAFVITNESERVEDPENATTAQEVINEFEKTFRQGNHEKKFIVYSVSINTPECLEKHKTETSQNAQYSKSLLELTEKTGGKSEDICLSDYSNAFSEISKHIHSRIQNLSLNFTPVVIQEESIFIDIVITNPDGTKERVLWEGDSFGRGILFSREILPNSKIEVQYFYDKNAQASS